MSYDVFPTEPLLELPMEDLRSEREAFRRQWRRNPSTIKVSEEFWKRICESTGRDVSDLPKKILGMAFELSYVKDAFILYRLA